MRIHQLVKQNNKRIVVKQKTFVTTLSLHQIPYLYTITVYSHIHLMSSVIISFIVSKLHFNYCNSKNVWIKNMVTLTLLHPLTYKPILI